MKKDVALPRETAAEEMSRYLTSQQPRPCWLPDGYTDPIRFVCLCIDHGARDIIGDSLPDPLEPLSELTAQRFFRGKRILWLFNVLCEQLAFEHGNAFSGSQNTADLLSSFAFLMEKFAIPYLTKRHKDNARMRNAIRSVCDSVKVETVKCAPMLDGSDGGEAHQLALAVVPDEFRRRLRDLLDLDAATRQTAQAADGGEIARKVADAVGNQLKGIQAETTAAVINSHAAKTAAETLLAFRLKDGEKRSERGKAAQAKAKCEGVNAAEKKRAADDMTTALNRVLDRVKNGEQVLAACRAVCRHFKKVGGSGKFGNETWLPLTGWNGKEIKPETLAKNYRTRFGTKKAKKGRGTK